MCGYCAPPGSGTRSAGETSSSFGVWALALWPSHYQALVDQGWRRSGQFVYKPDNLRTCCPQHPIRVSTDAFRLSKKQRRALGRLYWALVERRPPAKWKGAWAQHARTLADRLALVLDDADAPPPRRSFPPYHALPAERIHVRRAPATATDEKYALFRRYQSQVHGESEADISSRRGWERFLVDTPFPQEDTGDTELSQGLGAAGARVRCGTYHHEYRWVVDVLPRCVSSVYLYYDPDFSDWELGTVSALHEIALAQRLAASGVRWYYLGYYIHSCTKMRYKAQFRPSELLDTHENSWHPLAAVHAQLDGGCRVGFGARVGRGSDGPRRAPPHASETGRLPSPLPPGIARSAAPGTGLVLDTGGMRTVLRRWEDMPAAERARAGADGLVQECLAALGAPLQQRVAVVL
ncbi:arginyltransferase [Malassezia sp. CBS 17886]|nr:arginyltransferase [Malassezia sp. CBS 17886]